jgi:GxxExxY protein
MSKVVVPQDVETLAAATVNAALAVHRALGPGLLESTYQECLAIELSLAGIAVEREQVLPIVFRGRTVETAYRIDLLVGHHLLVELKAAEAIAPIHQAQVVTYLKLLDLPLGLLINFNVPLIKDGIHRILNLNFRSPPTASSIPTPVRSPDSFSCAHHPFSNLLHPPPFHPTFGSFASDLCAFAP